MTAQVVRLRLRLAAISPKLMQVYRKGDLTLEQLTAFALTEDHARQEAAFDRLSYHRDVSSIRRRLTETHVPASDRRARFVGIVAYVEAAGPSCVTSLARIAAAIWKIWHCSICW